MGVLFGWILMNGNVCVVKVLFVRGFDKDGVVVFLLESLVG